jgi:hypothetical protein
MVLLGDGLVTFCNDEAVGPIAVETVRIFSLVGDPLSFGWSFAAILGVIALGTGTEPKYTGFGCEAASCNRLGDACTCGIVFVLVQSRCYM